MLEVTLTCVVNGMGTKLRTTQIGPAPPASGPTKMSASGERKGGFLPNSAGVRANRGSSSPSK